MTKGVNKIYYLIIYMTFFIVCPHCNQTIEVVQINCRILSVPF